MTSSSERAALLSAAADALGDNDLGRRWVLTGGEDHPLLATFPSAKLPDAFRAIGRVGSAGANAVTVSGQDPHDLIGSEAGWDHYQP